MSRPAKRLTFLLLLIGLFLAGCTPRVRLGPTHIFHRGEPIEIEAKNFAFTPNHLVVRGNQPPLILLLKNSDDILHNFTLISTDRNIILTQDVKAKESSTVPIGFPKPENYTFYCSLHHHRGMEGMLMID
jgi:plastocyanin